MAGTNHAPKQVGVIGSGPNGLAAAIVMARAGFTTEVREAQTTAGGACRTMELTLPGFQHDFGSAVHPLAAGSPLFQRLPLSDYGLEWLHHDAPLAHPLDDGTAVVLERNLEAAAEELGPDGAAWKQMMEPLVRHWEPMVDELLQPLLHIPRHPFLLGRFGWMAAQPARLLACTMLRTQRARALFAGLAAHSFLSLDAPFSAAIALVLGAAAHAVGWPIPRGGAGQLSQALIGVLHAEGGSLLTGLPVHDLNAFEQDALVFFDTTPAHMATIAGSRFPAGFNKKLNRFQPGPGAFKLDYALSEPIPWTAAQCRRAGTVHLGGTLEEIARSERAMLRGRLSDKPYVLVAQPTLADPARAPQGKHVAWAYCHVPHGYAGDATAQIEAQIERFAPGFKECILARSVSNPARLQSMDTNLRGGDISGGAMHLTQLLLRPTWRSYQTPDPHLFLCSASTPPGAGVHGMCGYHAAKKALQRW
jgi:phytoene dehydrogenase-like protein